MSLSRATSKLALAFLIALVFPAWGSDPDQVLMSRDGVTVTRGDVERYIDTRVPEQHRSTALARPGAIREMLVQLYIIRTLAQEAQSLDGLDREAIQWQTDLQRDRIRMDALMQTRIAEAAARSDWEKLAREHYTANREKFETEEQVRAAHVLIRTEERSDDEALALAEEIAQRARNGEDFAALAEEHSEDPSAGGNRGDLGFFGKGQMVPEFEEAAFALQNEGDIAGPVKTQFGYHVIRLQARREAGVRPFDQVRDGIIRDLRNRQANEVRQEVIERVRSAEDIVADHEAIETLETDLRVDVGAMIREHREKEGGRHGE